MTRTRRKLLVLGWTSALSLLAACSRCPDGYRVGLATVTVGLEVDSTPPTGVTLILPDGAGEDPCEEWESGDSGDSGESEVTFRCGNEFYGGKHELEVTYEDGLVAAFPFKVRLDRCGYYRKTFRVDIVRDGEDVDATFEAFRSPSPSTY